MAITTEEEIEEILNHALETARDTSTATLAMFAPLVNVLAERLDNLLEQQEITNARLLDIFEAL